VVAVLCTASLDAERRQGFVQNVKWFGNRNEDFEPSLIVVHPFLLIPEISAYTLLPPHCLCNLLISGLLLLLFYQHFLGTAHCLCIMLGLKRNQLGKYFFRQFEGWVYHFVSHKGWVAYF